MKNINLNYSNATIELSESFAKKASTYNSEAYNKFIKIKNSFPDYKVVVIKSTAKKTKVKGITIEFMYNYAMNHEVENSAIEFAKLKGEKASYTAVKSTFFKFYPEFKDFKSKMQWILAA